MPKTNLPLLQKRHRIWLKLSASRRFPPTIRDLADAWGVNSTSVAAHTIATMVAHGLAGYEQHGKQKHYFPKEQE